MNLSEFIDGEIKKRNMSISEFGRFVGVHHTTISNALSDPDKQVSLEFLVKLSKATNTDLSSIVAMVHPERTTINPDVRILAERIANLPLEKRQMVESLLLGMSIQPDKSPDK